MKSYSTITMNRRRLSGFVLMTIFVLNTTAVFVFVWRPTVIFSVESYFVPPMSASNKHIFRRTLMALAEVLEKINATYFITSGTLIGSFRHHGFIPWDDDLDIIVGKAHKAHLYDALKLRQPEYGVYPKQRPVDTLHWKFYSISGTDKVVFETYRWPYIDIFFFDEDDQWVWNESPWFPDERWPRSVVFPLVRRPFEGLWLPAPCDTAAVLAVNFHVDQCASRSRSHFYEVRLLSTIVVPCDELRARFPFVTRHSRVNASDNLETLKIAARTLNTLRLPSKCLTLGERHVMKQNLT